MILKNGIKSLSKTREKEAQERRAKINAKRRPRNKWTVKNTDPNI